MKKILALLLSGLIVSGCVTHRMNSDGSVETVSVDKVKLSDTYVNLAIEYQKHNAPQIALERVNLAVETNSSNARAYMVRGMIYASLHKPVDAETNFKKAISIQKDFPDAYVNYAAFLCEQGRYADADKNFNTALDNPLYYTPEIGYYNKGECFLKQKKYEAANQAFLQSLTYKTPPADSYLSLARLQYVQQNYVLAKYYIDRFNGEQSPASLWLHIQILQAILDNKLAPNSVKENTSYRNTIAVVLMDNYGNSQEAQQCLMRYGGSVNKNNLIVHPDPVPGISNSPSSTKAASKSVSNANFKMIKPKSQQTQAAAPVVKPPVANSVVPSSATGLVGSLSSKSDAALANVAVQSDASGRKFIIVPAGATMYAVSRKFNISIAQIEQFNKTKVTQISKGMKLYIE